ncbi:MAG: DegT/DnrJ/EryC1/StrS family aminotransferase [Syntrophales bacterium]|nr:DegT/DnrJ/EryC1/StrS family aminotransferase [Syntrophales bacterium]MDD5642407.1 DegT/DnrJ/EryC1/StrS family aminotransferase [Syntrophales bacterium]
MTQIPVARPTLGEEEAAAARRAILSGWVVQGPEVAAFEKEFAALMGAPLAVACSSGTAALHLALAALDLGPGDEVITVSHSFIATANAVRYVGATPVFVDVEYLTGNIDPELIGAALTPRTRVILVPHQLGMPCDLGRILALAREHNLKVVEDAACAIGAEISLAPGDWEPIGRPHGDLATFSFHPRKVLTTGDGGMITGTDPEIMARMARLRTHAMSLSTAERERAGGIVFEQYAEVGYNYRLSDIQGAVGREQVKRLPGLVAERRRLAARYREALENQVFLDLPQEPVWGKSNWQSFWIILKEECPRQQRQVMQALLEKGIRTVRGVMCAHREPAYRELPSRFPLPVSERLQDRSIILPLYPGMTDDEQERVVSALMEILK